MGRNYERKHQKNSVRATLFIALVLISSCASSPPEYDFIVVGGGTAGCVVAARLAESGRYSVLILHEGDFPDPRQDVPYLSSQLLVDPSIVKNYAMVTQQNAAQAGNGTTFYMVGQRLGGGSSVNGMYWHRGSISDFDNYATIANDDSWNYANMLKYFKRSENYEGGFPSDEHGQGGPITVSRPTLYVPQLSEWLEAGKYLGYPILDPNPQRVSFTPIEYSMNRGRRVSSYTGYIKSNPKLASRGNLRTMTNSPVTRILFDGSTAVGVIYGRGRLQNTVRARKEVIISSGVIGSPTLLMRSGVGPKDVLDRVKIPPVKYLPVGENFRDHTLLGLEFVLNNRSAVLDPERDLTQENWKLYNELGDGPYINYGAGNAQALIASSSQRRAGQGKWPDIQVFNFLTNRLPEGVTLEATVSQGIQTAEWETVAMVGTEVRGKSQGRILLNPENVEGDPILDLQYMSHPDDMEIMLDAVELMLEIYEETPSMKQLGARYPPNPIPGCERMKFRSKDYWKCYITQRAQAGVHAVGTCSIGAGWKDPNAVVDSNFSVIGIDRLRVVDASVIPRATSANPQAAIYGVAEKASDTILTKWNNIK